MKSSIGTLVCFFVLCMPYISLAHHGHGESGGFTITHYITEPVHIAVSASILISIVVYIRYLGSKRQPKENS